MAFHLNMKRFIINGPRLHIAGYLLPLSSIHVTLPGSWKWIVKSPRCSSTCERVRLENPLDCKLEILLSCAALTYIYVSLYELERTNADPEASLIQVHVNWPLLPLCCAAVVPEQYSRERCECQPIRKLIVPFPRVNCSQSKKEFVWKWVNALTYFHTQYILAE